MENNRTVLVVDDTESNIDMVLAILKDYDVIPATNGEDAIEIANSESVDLVLLDILMPNIDGFEVCKRLKSNEKTSSIPVIFLTAKSDEESIEEGYAVGGIDFVSKPFKPRELLAKVKTTLELRRYQLELEERVAFETQKRVTQENLLLQRSKLAEMGEMISAITHQWRQPITALSMILDDFEDKYFEDDLSQEDFKGYFKEMKKQISHMDITIDTFKNFLKPCTKKDFFDIKETLTSVVELLKPLLKMSFTEVTLNFSNEDLFLDGNQNELKQVFFNIVKNSADAIGTKFVDGGGKITISVKKSENEIVVIFKDNGGGFQEDLLPDKIFSLYTSTKGDKGTGIGLNICKTIIYERFNGKICAKNEDGGAVIEISLPTRKEDFS